MRISDWSSDVCSSDLSPVIQSSHLNALQSLSHNAYWPKFIWMSRQLRMSSMSFGNTSCPSPEQSAERRARQRWLSVLAKAEFGDLDTLWNNLPSKPAWTVIRAPEVGMVMARGRAGGTGERFNLGERAVTRCAVQLDYGAVGFGSVMGRNKRHAELAEI